MTTNDEAREAIARMRDMLVAAAEAINALADTILETTQTFRELSATLGHPVRCQSEHCAACDDDFAEFEENMRKFTEGGKE